MELSGSPAQNIDMMIMVVQSILYDDDNDDNDDDNDDNGGTKYIMDSDKLVSRGDAQHPTTYYYISGPPETLTRPAKGKFSKTKTFWFSRTSP